MTGNSPLEVIIEPVKARFSEHIKKIRFFLPCKYLDPLCHEREPPLKHLFNRCNRPYLSLLLHYLVLFHREFDVLADFFWLRAEHQVGVGEVEVAELGSLH